MREGKILMLRIGGTETGTTRDEVIGLAGFAAALADYRARRAAFTAQPAR